MNNFIVDTQPAVEILVLWYYGISKTTSLFFNKGSSFLSNLSWESKNPLPTYMFANICLNIFIYVCQYFKYNICLQITKQLSLQYLLWHVSSNILDQITQILNHENILDQIFFSYLLKNSWCWIGPSMTFDWNSWWITAFQSVIYFMWGPPTANMVLVMFHQNWI